MGGRIRSRNWFLDRYCHLRSVFFRHTQANVDARALFTRIYRNNEWGGKDSVSGTGSALMQTQVLIRRLPEIFHQLDVHNVLDIPCGDFFWMKQVDLKGIEYLGADIVDQLIHRNSMQHETSNVRFQQLDLLRSRLPEVDLVICRDCLVHFSNRDVARSLANISRSGSKYLLTTTFSSRAENVDIATGGWRPLNLEKPPFSLPPAISILNEGCTEGGGNYVDKSLGLWSIREIIAGSGELSRGSQFLSLVLRRRA